MVYGTSASRIHSAVERSHPPLPLSRLAARGGADFQGLPEHQRAADNHTTGL